MRIGITYNQSSSFWSCGAFGGVLFLAEALSLLPGVEVQLLYAAKEAPVLPWQFKCELVHWSQAGELDVLVEGIYQLLPEQIEATRRNGGKIIGYRCGNTWAIDTERVIHNKEAGALFEGTVYDTIWTTAQHWDTCASLWETLYRCPVVQVPHVWSPRMLAGFPVAKPYTAGSRRSIGIVEPNINLIKTFVIPLMACERFYRKHPEKVEWVAVWNSKHLKEHPTLKGWANALNLQRDSRVSFEGRVPLRELIRYNDLFVCHQFQNALNHIYYELLWLGYPLVHNSILLPNGGYYYQRFDVQQAAKALRRATEEPPMALDEVRLGLSCLFPQDKSTAQFLYTILNMLWKNSWLPST